MSDTKNDSDKAPLQEALQEHYEQASLSPDRFEALQTMLASHEAPAQVTEVEDAPGVGISFAQSLGEKSKASTPGTAIAAPDGGETATLSRGPALVVTFTWTKYAPLFAALGFMISLGWYTSWPEAIWGPKEPATPLEKIVAEIANNHHKYKTHATVHVKALAMSLASKQKALPKLPFTLTTPDRIIGKGWVLRNGKYCSLQGARAALLHYQHQGKIHSLYQVKWPTSLAPKIAHKLISRSHSGLTIRLWRQGDLLFGLASP